MPAVGSTDSTRTGLPPDVAPFGPRVTGDDRADSARVAEVLFPGVICPSGGWTWREKKEKPPGIRWREESSALSYDKASSAPRSLRRYDPDQVPRDFLNPAMRDTPGG